MVAARPGLLALALLFGCAGGEPMQAEPDREPLLELATLDLSGAQPEAPGPPPAGHRFTHLSGAPSAAGAPEGHLALGFADLLAPAWRPPRAIETEDRPALGEALPEAVWRADGARAVLEGFPLPADGRGRDARRWILTPAPNGCCATGPAPFDQLVLVRLGADPGWDGDPYRPVRVAGRFRVEERLDEFGFLECLYRLDEAHRIDDSRPYDR